jgi:hypothetical protein
MRSIVLFVALSISTVAHAADYSAVLTDLRGDPIVDEFTHGPRDPETGKFVPARACTKIEYAKDPSNCEALTLGGAAANALLVNDPDNPNLDEKEKRRRGNLADRLFRGGNIDLDPKDVVLIQRMISKVYGNLVIMRALPLLDPNIDKR